MPAYSAVERSAAARPLPLALHIYRMLLSAAGPFVSALVSSRLKRGKEDPARIGERRGETALARPPGALIWVHGASVGEIAAVIPLVERLSARGFNILVTSGTVGSAHLARQRLPAAAIHQFVPWDNPRFVARFLSHWKPDLALFSESDLWPNLIVTSCERRIPLVLVNGRLSERSYRRWRYAPASIAAVLGCFDLCLAQTAPYAARYHNLGAPRVITTGNLKLDVPEPPADLVKLAALRSAIGDRIVVAAASTHPGEETAVAEAHRRLRHTFPRLLTVIAPRHPDRGPGIAEIAAARGLSSTLRSHGRLPREDDDIYIFDTLGELGILYRLAPIVFVGGSLVGHGGQNPVEPVKLGGAILHGPHVWNFAEIYAALNAAHGAEQISDVGKLAVQIGAWLADPVARKNVAVAASATVEKLSGALDRTLAALEPYLLQIRLESQEPQEPHA